MTIKELIYIAQQHLQASTGLAFKRTYIYELLAALFDFNSYAALCSEAVFIQKKQDIFTQWRQDEKQSSQHNADIRKRCVELGYSTEIADTVSSHLPTFIDGHQLDVVKLSDLVDDLRSEPPFSSEHMEWYDIQFPPILLDELENAASKNNMLAHYALALINFTDKEEVVNDYWFTQEQKGRVLTGVEKEWADTYKKFLAKPKKCSFHLREAARLGSKEALLDLADRFDDPAFF